ncbi:MAG: HAD-IB family phosphatase [Saprospiraceae bacterium]|nr:HAD-IB family phosphatase [Saprospiraceae bacterium]
MSENQNKWLILFDFDGTLTSSNSLLEYLLFAAQWGRRRGREGRRLRAWRRLLWAAPALMLRLAALFFSGKWSNGGAKESIIGYFFAGKTRAELTTLAERFCQEQLPGRLRGDLMEKLRAYRGSGATVAVVSASLDLWLQPFCAREGLHMVCTEAGFQEDRFTGRFATPNCNHAEKARRVSAAFDLAQYDRVIAFGNSRGDYAMFELADEAWLCRPDGSLKPVKDGRKTRVKPLNLSGFD